MSRIQADGRIGVLNRGECAHRFFKTHRRLKLQGRLQTKAVALVPADETRARWHRLCDEVSLFTNPSLKQHDDSERASVAPNPFMDISRIAETCDEHRIDAVWPGWGFLSEDPHLAQALLAQNIIFIGPEPPCLRLFGDKGAARKAALEQGLTQIPGHLFEPSQHRAEDYAQHAASVLNVAQDIGFPLIFKETFGGGGRGITIVEDSQQLQKHLENRTSSLSAQQPFLLEAYIDDARHIELQVVADQHGFIKVLGTRDCTLQRNHQKVFEMGPALCVPPRLLEETQGQCKQWLHRLNYHGLATVELLYSPRREQLYFLEVNPRLQVEHPVTELLYDVDLVELQLAIAQGESLKKNLENISASGYAIEARLNAEDPSQGFKPGPGSVRQLNLPYGANLRVDTGVQVDDEIHPSYDPMIAKVIAYGQDRNQAIHTLRSALQDCEVLIEGGHINIGYLSQILEQSDVYEDKIDTRWLHRHHGELTKPQALEYAWVAAAILAYCRDIDLEVGAFYRACAGGIPTEQPHDSRRQYGLRCADQTIQVRVTALDEQSYRLQNGDRCIDVQWVGLAEGKAQLICGSKKHQVIYAGRTGHWFLCIDGRNFDIEQETSGQLSAPSAGIVLSVLTEEGASVQKGETVAIVEAMKMELPVKASQSGVVTTVHCQPNQPIQLGQPLLSIEVERELCSEPTTSSTIGLPNEASGNLVDYLAATTRFMVSEEDVPGWVDVIQKAPDLDAPKLVCILERYRCVRQLFSSRWVDAYPQHEAYKETYRTLYYEFCRRYTEGISEAATPIVHLLQNLLGAESLQPTKLRYELWRFHVLHRQSKSCLQILSALLEKLVAQKIELNAEQKQVLVSLASVLDPAHARQHALIASALHCKEETAEHTQRNSGVRALNFAYEPTPAGFRSELFWNDSTTSVVHLVSLERDKDQRLVLNRQYGEGENTRNTDDIDWDQAFFDALHVLRAQRLMRGQALGFNDEVRFWMPKPTMVPQRAAIKETVERWSEHCMAHGIRRVVFCSDDALGEDDSEAGGRIQSLVAEFARVGVITLEKSDGLHLPKLLSKAEQRAIRCARLNVHYPYDVIAALTGERHALNPFFTEGKFEEWDLDDTNTLVPVNRPYGENRCGLVVGVMHHQIGETDRRLSRVWIASDPSLAMGALAEPECRRIIAGFELAERLGLAVEWLPISAGAKIAMDSGTENLDWTAAVLAKIIDFTEAGHCAHVIVAGVNVGAQSYWNAEATMLMHTKGLLIMTEAASMVLTGRKALAFSGAVSGDDETDIGGAENIMGPNGQAQHVVQDLSQGYALLARHYRLTHPRTGSLRSTSDDVQRSITEMPYRGAYGYQKIGDIFDASMNAHRKKPFEIRTVMNALRDQDGDYLERFHHERHAENAVVWETQIGGTGVMLLGIESTPLPRRGQVPQDGPKQWNGGTLYPRSARKIARALNAASGDRPVVILANLSGFDGSPESMRRFQLEYGAEIGRAVHRFEGPILFVVVGRYHGGAYVVFSKRLNPRLHVLAIDGSFASVIGGQPAAAVVLTREVRQRVQNDKRIQNASRQKERGQMSNEAFEALRNEVAGEQRTRLAIEFDAIHSIHRAVEVGSVDAVISAAELRPKVIEYLQKMANGMHISA